MRTTAPAEPASVTSTGRTYDDLSGWYYIERETDTLTRVRQIDVSITHPLRTSNGPDRVPHPRHLPGPVNAPVPVDRRGLAPDADLPLVLGRRDRHRTHRRTSASPCWRPERIDSSRNSVDLNGAGPDFTGAVSAHRARLRQLGQPAHRHRQHSASATASPSRQARSAATRQRQERRSFVAGSRAALVAGRRPLYSSPTARAAARPHSLPGSGVGPTELLSSIRVRALAPLDFRGCLGEGTPCERGVP